MRTNLNAEIAAIGSDRDAGDVEKTMGRFLSSLADTAALLDLEVEELWKTGTDSADPKRYEQLKGLIREANKLKAQIAEIEAKSGTDKLDETNAMNLEAARAEILRRFARLAAAENADDVSE